MLLGLVGWIFRGFSSQWIVETPGAHCKCWQVRVGYSHHTVDLPQDSIKSEKALCFAIDAKQQDDAVEPPKKKQKNIPKKAR